MAVRAVGCFYHRPNIAKIWRMTTEEGVTDAVQAELREAVKDWKPIIIPKRDDEL